MVPRGRGVQVLLALELAVDTMGLLAALRWQSEETCKRANLRCSENYPDEELHLNRAVVAEIEDSVWRARRRRRWCQRWCQFGRCLNQ